MRELRHCRNKFLARSYKAGPKQLEVNLNYEETSMDVRQLFRGISTKLLVDFETSAGMNHQGNKGAFRESALREFLSDNRLPARFGLGTGEVVSSFGGVSRQSDIVVYDRLNSIPLLYNESVQVFPIESVYGVIEIKSRLSKEELIKSLDNIKSIKDLVIGGGAAYSSPMATKAHNDSRPFGIVFAYALASNSLESLTENLKDWERENPSKFWPNMIVVLGEGIIQHYGDGAMACLSSQELLRSIYPCGLHHEGDSFFHFYSTLLTLCSGVELPRLNLNSYYIPARRVDDIVVRHHDDFVHPDSGRKAKMTDDFIRRVIDYCSRTEKISYEEMLASRFGYVPEGFTPSQLAVKLYLYNPEGLPAGSPEVVKEIMTGGKAQKEQTLFNMYCIQIDNVTYAIAMDSMTSEDFEVFN